MLLPRFSSVSTLALLGEVLVAALSLHQTPNSQMVSIDALQSPDNRTKVPGQSPAYHCSNPTDDVFKIRQLDFIPTNPRMQVIKSATFRPSSNFDHSVATP